MVVELPRVIEHKVAEILVLDFALHLGSEDLSRDPVPKGKIERMAANIASKAKRRPPKPLVGRSLIASPYIDYLFGENAEQSREEFRTLVYARAIRLFENLSEAVFHLNLSISQRNRYSISG